MYFLCVNFCYKAHEMRQRQSPPTSNDMGAKDIGVNHFLNSEYRWLMMWPWKWYIFYFPHIHNIRKYYDGEKISLKILTNVHIFSIPEYRHITWEDTVIEIISLVILTDLCIFSPPLNTKTLFMEFRVYGCTSCKDMDLAST